MFPIGTIDRHRTLGLELLTCRLVGRHRHCHSLQQNLTGSILWVLNFFGKFGLVRVSREKPQYFAPYGPRLGLHTKKQYFCFFKESGLQGSNGKFQVNFTKNENGKFVALDLEVIARLLHLWLFSLLHLWTNFITFMVSGFITFVVKSYYIYGQYYIYGYILIHL